MPRFRVASASSAGVISPDRPRSVTRASLSQAAGTRKARSPPRTKRDGLRPRTSGSDGVAPGPLVFSVLDDPREDVETEGEDPQVPPRVGAGDRDQRPEGAEARTDDADEAAICVADHQREAAGDLNDAEDDQKPSVGTQIADDQPHVAGEDVGITDR